MGMDINQMIELWRGLSPRLARTIPDQEIYKDEYTYGEESNGDSEDEAKGRIESHPEENPV
jgi:hypothetical protein